MKKVPYINFEEYILRVAFESSLLIKSQLLKGKSLHPAVKEISIKTESNESQKWQLKSLLVAKFSAPSNEKEMLEVAEDIAYTFLGFLGFYTFEGISLDQFEVVKKDEKGILQNYRKFIIGKRTLNHLFPINITLNSEERLSIYWIGRGLNAARPDDRLSFYYAAVEALVSSLKGIKTICHCCNRPYATAPIKNFLINSCSIQPDNANKIITARNDILHGRLSAVQKYEDYLHLSGILLEGLRVYYKNKFKINFIIPPFQVAERTKIFFEKRK